MESWRYILIRNKFEKLYKRVHEVFTSDSKTNVNIVHNIIIIFLRIEFRMYFLYHTKYRRTCSGDEN